VNPSPSLERITDIETQIKCIGVPFDRNSQPQCSGVYAPEDREKGTMASRNESITTDNEGPDDNTNQNPVRMIPERVNPQAENINTNTRDHTEGINDMASSTFEAKMDKGGNPVEKGKGKKNTLHLLLIGSMIPLPLISRPHHRGIRPVRRAPKNRQRHVAHTREDTQ
jgi:hypothetical protein